MKTIIEACEKDMKNFKKYLNEALSIDSSDYEEWNDFGDLLLNNKKGRSALKCYQKSLKLDDSQLEIVTKMVRLLLALKEFDKCLKYCTKGLELCPSEVPLLKLRAKCYAALSKNDLSQKDEEKIKHLGKINQMGTKFFSGGQEYDNQAFDDIFED